LNADDEVEPVDDVLAEHEMANKPPDVSSFYDEDDGPLDDQLQSISLQKAGIKQRFDAVKQA
jgi:hypothetical protein